MGAVLQVKYDTIEVEQKATLKHAVEGDAGFDLFNASNETIIVAPYRSVMIPSCLRVKIPSGYCALIYPRSSTFRRRGLFVVPGLIDSGYTGELFTYVWHPNLDHTDKPILIEPWERLSQLLVLPVPELDVISVKSLPETVRGEHGFGSSGF